MRLGGLGERSRDSDGPSKGGGFRTRIRNRRLAGNEESRGNRKSVERLLFAHRNCPFEMEAGGGGHGHSDHHHSQQMPPISYQERSSSRPMELLTDAVGRPAYGRIDPTVFMLISYPLFFGMMLGDIAMGSPQ